MPSPASSVLVEAKRRAASDHVLAAARRLVLGGGLDVTMDQLAEAAGVSRRTLFRMFTSRDRLLAAAFEAGMADYRQRLPTYTGGDPDSWLRSTCTVAHRMNAAIGPGFFELASRRDHPPELVAAERKRLREFRAATSEITRTLWTAHGGVGKPPPSVEATVTAHLSPHFTAALVVDAGRDWQAASELARAAILSAVQRALGIDPGTQK